MAGPSIGEDHHSRGSGRMSFVPALVGDRIQLERVLGQGGVSAVWLGYDLSHGGPVAVKMISPAAVDDPAALDRVDRDARAVAALGHPNIVSVYGAGIDSGHPYQVLELVEGPSLAAVLGRGALPVGQAVDIARQVCRAVAAAHAAGVVHGDLRPDNVLLAPGGLVKLSDFGIAHLRYAGAADPGTDLYGLGRLLYAMLSGAHVADELPADPPSALYRWRPDLPPELVTLIGDLLAGAPVGVDEVSSRLAEVAGDAAPPAAPSQPLAENGPRHLLPAAGRPRALLVAAAGRPRALLVAAVGRPRALLVAAAAVLAVLLTGLTAMMLSGGADPVGGPATTDAAPATGMTIEPIPTGEPAPSTPAAVPPTPRSPRAADLIAAARARLPQLVRAGQLSPESARELDRRLAEAARELAAGQTSTALSTLRAATNRLAKLRDQNKLSAAGYDTLKAALAEVADALSER